LDERGATYLATSDTNSIVSGFPAPAPPFALGFSAIARELASGRTSGPDLDRCRPV
jgi:hypothetical protein